MAGALPIEHATKHNGSCIAPISSASQRTAPPHSVALHNQVLVELMPVLAAVVAELASDDTRIKVAGLPPRARADTLEHVASVVAKEQGWGGVEGGGGSRCVPATTYKLHLARVRYRVHD